MVGENAVITLNEQIEHLTGLVLDGSYSLDDALNAQEHWLDAHMDAITEEERNTFRASLQTESSNDNRSLIDSVLKLHTTRLLVRHEVTTTPGLTLSESPTAYEVARTAYVDALRTSEREINEARIDIAIANAHNLLGNVTANRRWLDIALGRLPDLAHLDLVQLARRVPPMPVPEMSRWKRWSLKLMGISLDKLAARNQDSLVEMALMQTDQIIILAHLVGTSFEAIRDRDRANRAFRNAAHLIIRLGKMHTQDPVQLIELAEDLQRSEAESARVLARQALENCQPGSDNELAARAQEILSN